MENGPTNNREILVLTVDIVASHVSNNTVPVGNVSTLIEEVFNTLAKINNENYDGMATLSPAVPVKKSVTPDYVICLEDGKKLKMLKRHLKSHFNLTPEDYRKKWGLPSDYPMVAPNYALKRRELAKKIGLGRGRKKNDK